MDLCGCVDIGHMDIQMWTQWCGNRCKFGEMYNTNWMWYLDVVVSVVFGRRKVLLARCAGSN